MRVYKGNSSSRYLGPSDIQITGEVQLRPLHCGRLSNETPRETKKNEGHRLPLTTFPNCWIRYYPQMNVIRTESDKINFLKKIVYMNLGFLRIYGEPL